MAGSTTGRRRRDGKRKPKARNAENPSTPLNVIEPDDDTFEAFGSSRSASGIRVTHKKALGYPAIWRAVNLIAGAVAKLPLNVYRYDGENKKLDEKHAAYGLCAIKPNDLHTAFVFKQTLMGHALMRGNGYAFIDRDGPKPVGLYLLDPQKVTPLRVKGEGWYVYGDGSNLDEYRKLPAVDVLHVRGLGYDGLQGYPVIELLADSVGAALATRDYGAKHFKNGARPGGAIKHPGKLSPQAVTSMRESWERMHKGLDNVHKVTILQEGADYIPFVSSAREAQLLESRSFDSREIANIFGVPAHKLGDSAKVAYNSLEQENQSFYDDTLSHWCKLVSEEASDKLLSEKEKKARSHVVDFDYQELQRANLGSLTTFVNSMVDRGVMTVNEARSVFGLNPIPGGDVLRPRPVKSEKEAGNAAD